MMPNMFYQQWEIERTHTIAEQRLADRRRGEAAAAVSGSLRRLRLRMQRPAVPSGVAGHVPARAHADVAACNAQV
jgi:hypothetical protein